MSLKWYAHVPLRFFERYLPVLAQRGWNPELALQAADLDSCEPGYFANIGARLASAGLDVTVHAPFMDLNSGAIDPAVQEATRRRYHQTFDAAARLGARLIVFHPGYDPWHYGAQTRSWQEQALAFWPEFLRRADQDGITLAMENIFDRTSRLLCWLVRSLDHPRFGHCFDIGHWQLFGTQDLIAWLENLGDRLVHLHLHDNRGRNDDHLPLGAGKINFNPLWQQLQTRKTLPTMTLEAHSLEDLERSVAVFQSMRSPLDRT